ncbi:monocarboxylate transporter 7-like isoform X2 [Cylas formicarius]|uniref:monocarboxylate transporter 7-like isoform X2 n=1 Tax=Cylas formicarius TaxID=197179 RepID=UPI002958D550|nr:monocarboxylate transporter 7-like isoform X2 [Cylas formicarius]
MEAKKMASSENQMKYKHLPPDGGWGYAVAVASTVIFVVTIIPMAAFGLIFGNFLSSVGDETTGTTLANGIFNTVSSFMGLIVNVLLNMYSFRKVAFAGSLIFSLGTIGVIFCTNMAQFIISFGVIEGIGFGLLMPAAFSALNSYFDKKMALVMSVSQAIMVAGNMFMPILAAYFINILGFRGTLIVIAVLSLCSFPCAVVLQPVQWHCKKVAIEDEIVLDVDIHSRGKTRSLGEDVLKSQIEPLMHQNEQYKHLGASRRSLHHKGLVIA